jgi:glycosyltransferase involved in cell wall biosynthesis
MGTAAGGELLCVAPVAPHKGHDVLLRALVAVAQLRWRCACVGPLDRDPEFVTRLRRQAVADGVADRVRLTGPLTGAALDRAYQSADLLVHASRGETYGMVVSEALARGLPVIASDTGGLPDTLGHATGGCRPGLLDPTGTLVRWLTRCDAG